MKRREFPFVGRLPDGKTITHNTRLYLKTWRRFNRALERVFPGFHVSGWEPGIVMVSPTEASIELDARVARRIVELASKEKKGEKT